MALLVAAGDVLAGKYRVERMLGSGGMGVVFAARHLALQRRVAIKLMLPSRGGKDAVARFLREGRAAARIRSAHVARVHDVDTLPNGEPYLVMEYLGGRDLGAVLRDEGPLSVHDAIDVLLQASEAVAVAHASGIIHRDLKPSNLFMTRDLDGAVMVKVIDFGISKDTHAAQTGPSQDVTCSAVVMGSPAYMPPEQMRSARNADARSDIWALGAILCCVLTGRPPFAGESIAEIYDGILGGPPRIRDRRPDVPAGLDEVVGRCLQRDPAARYADVAAFAQAIAPFGPPAAAARATRIAGIASHGPPEGGESIPPEPLEATLEAAEQEAQDTALSEDADASEDASATADADATVVDGLASSRSTKAPSDASWDEAPIGPSAPRTGTKEPTAEGARAPAPGPRSWKRPLAALAAGALGAVLSIGLLASGNGRLRGLSGLAEPTPELSGSREAKAAEGPRLTRRIPLRFMHLRDCSSSSCDTGHISVDDLYRIVDRANGTFETAGVELWIKSNEIVDAPAFTSDAATTRTWAEVSDQLRRMFAGQATSTVLMPADAYPPSDRKSVRDWLAAAAAYYGDEDVVHVYVVDGSGAPFGQPPDEGRSLHLSARAGLPPGADDLAHALRGFFGVAPGPGATGILDPATGDPGARATPASLSLSQLPSIDAYLRDNIGFTPDRVRLLQRSDMSNPVDGHPRGLTSLRRRLGEADDDLVYWANGTVGVLSNTAFSFASSTIPVSGHAYTTASGDLDADGNDDIVWCSTVTTFGSVWWGNADRTFTRDDRPGLCPAGAVAVRAGQLGGGDAEDLLFYVPATRTAHLKYGSPDRSFTDAALPVAEGRHVPIVGDFDGLHRDDVFWYEPDAGIVHRWYSDARGGFAHHDGHGVDPGGPFVPVVGDFDGALGDDIFWYKAGPGGDRIWYSRGGGSLGFTKVSSISDVVPAYTPLSGDFDGDGKDDIFWDRPLRADDSIWSGDLQPAQFKSHPASVHGRFAPIGGDFDGDGLSDIFWYCQ